jgi:alkanesulfonate monooxygenase SsuD/methylene tetrahydromethanopterin reductase-like flavin-dependent oxidoreductase (luciferase family)
MAGASVFAVGLTDHVEGPADRPSADIFAEVSDIIRLADHLGVQYAWFSEHHCHAHHGHLPAPLLFALHLAEQTRHIRLGTAIICLNLHHPLAIAEQIAVADTLAGGRLAVGFGSGSTPEEFGLFGLPVTEESERHERFGEALQTIRSAWAGPMLPTPAGDLAGRCWVAVNSVGSARIAGLNGFNMMFSHLRTPEQYRDYSANYRAAGGRGLIAANRPIYVGANDASAFTEAEPALRTLWRRFLAEGKFAADSPEPTEATDLCAHPINFIVGGTETVARQLRDLHAASPFDVLNAEVRWAGLSPEHVKESLGRLMEKVMPTLASQRDDGIGIG